MPNQSIILTIPIPIFIFHYLLNAIEIVVFYSPTKVLHEKPVHIFIKKMSESQTRARNQMSHMHQVSHMRHMSHPWDMLNNFCFQVYIQK